MRLINFFKRIPEFDQLTVEDKMVLIRHNLMPLITVNTKLSFDSETRQPIANNDNLPWNSALCQQVFGHELVTEMKNTLESFVILTQCDQKIVQLVLIVLILTKGFSTEPETPDTILVDGPAVYRAQCYYSELLWKYMESVHGLDVATHIFHKMISRCIAWQTLDSKIRRDIRQKLSPADEDELSPLMKSLLNIS